MERLWHLGMNPHSFPNILTSFNMKKIFNLNTGQLFSYPRSDNEAVIGLADEYIILDEITEPFPGGDVKSVQRIDITAKTVTHGWENLSAEEIAQREASLMIPLPDAKRYQLKVWLVRNGIALSTVPSIIESAIPVGPEREEALVRWNDVELVPADHPLVAIVAARMTPPVAVADVWPEILAIR